MNVDQSEDRKLDELLRQSYAELRQTKSDQRQAVLDGLSDARRNANPPVRHASRRWQQWALAAACLIALFAAWSWRTTGPGNVAYGIDDMPQRLAEVKSISIRGWQWIRDSSGANKPPTRVPIEFLIQRPGRFRYTVAGISSRGGRTESCKMWIYAMERTNGFWEPTTNRSFRGRSAPWMPCSGRR